MRLAPGVVQRRARRVRELGGALRLPRPSWRRTCRSEVIMALDVLKEKGVPLDRQVFTWRELAGKPFSKLDDDAFTRVRVILMNGVEAEAVRFSHACARKNRALQPSLARVRRIDHHQGTMVNWLNP